MEVRVATGDAESLKRTLRRHKRGNRPPEPATLADLEVDDEWSTTGGTDPENFMIHDSGAQSADRVIVFATDEALRHLGQAHEWFIDGTFACAPKLFHQLYVIRAPLGDTSVTCVYAFMTGKSQALYEELFRSVNNKCSQLGFQLDPSVVISDFEQAVIGAVQNVFGNHVCNRCCFYHLTQSTWRRVQETGLASEYKSNPDVRHFCGMIDGLAFLPLSDVSEGMTYLRSIAPTEAQPVLDYFDSTYVSGSLRPIQRPGHTLRMRFRRIRPAFPHPLHYDAMSAAGPALGMFEVFGRTVPPTLGEGRHFGP